MLEPTTDATTQPADTTTTPASWSTPDFTVVDTAMEVTAYSLNAL
ncbi:pyrroloquinoline quinone precursor peptide PqqA [Streptomyces sp. NBC_00102]|nr:pyrroloquinoline quinone precursor peptide PqqA [Streptomyces sp. NBC_00102]MCX5395527.1 pyrroloquinoline quinone precursor peptide PqqA [Streptomyces sp. NBC_00102]